MNSQSSSVYFRQNSHVSIAPPTQETESFGSRCLHPSGIIFACMCFWRFSQMDLTCQPQWIQSRCLRAAGCLPSDIIMRLKSILRRCSNRKGGWESTSSGCKSKLHFSQPLTAHLCMIWLLACSFNWITSYLCIIYMHPNPLNLPLYFSTQSWLIYLFIVAFCVPEVTFLS